MNTDAENLQYRVNGFTPMRNPAAGADSPARRAAPEGEPEFALRAGDRRWRVFPLRATPRRGEPLRAEVLIVREGLAPAAFHLDTCNLSSARARARFARAAAVKLDTEPDALERELDQLISPLFAQREAQLEAGRRANHRRAPAAQGDAAPALGKAERAEAEAFLRDPNLLARVEADLALNGLEGPTALLGYLAGTSRLSPKPLALLIAADAATGVRRLPSRVLGFFSEESIFRSDRPREKLLAGLAETALQHKILALSEYRASPGTRHALRSFVEDGQYVADRPEEDPNTDESSFRPHLVRGPVALFLRTPQVDDVEEFDAPCLVLPREVIGDPPRGPQRRRAQVDAELEAEARRRISRQAQGLLEPLIVDHPVVPESPQSIPPRDGERYDRTRLAVAASIALLHQRQRTITTRRKDGKLVRCIASTREDFIAADLPPRTAQLLAQLCNMVDQLVAVRGGERSPVYFDRCQVREWVGGGFGATQVYERLRQLRQLGYVIVRAGGPGKRLVYELDRARCAEALAGRSPSSLPSPVTPVPEPAEPEPEGLEATPAPTAPETRDSGAATDLSPPVRGAFGQLSPPVRAAFGQLSGAFRGGEKTANPAESLEKSQNGAARLHNGPSCAGRHQRSGANGGGSADAGPLPNCTASAQAPAGAAHVAPPHSKGPAPSGPETRLATAPEAPSANPTAARDSGAATDLSPPVRAAFGQLSGAFRGGEKTANSPESLEKSQNGAAHLHNGPSCAARHQRSGANGGGSADAPPPPNCTASAQAPAGAARVAPSQSKGPAPSGPETRSATALEASPADPAATPVARAAVSSEAIAPPPRARSRAAPNGSGGKPALSAPNPPDPTGAPLRGAPAHGHCSHDEDRRDD